MGSHVRGLAEARPALHVSCGFTLACWDAPQGLWRTRDAHNSENRNVLAPGPWHL